MIAAPPDRDAPASPATARARALVELRTPAAEALGRAAGDPDGDLDALVTTLRAGLAELADPDYLGGQQRVAPGIGPVIGVRQPLLNAVTRGLRSATGQDSTSTLLDIADRMLREPEPELHWLAFDLLDRSITADPERTWQLVRAEARAAREWITVDALARVAGRGILAEPYRWAELEQLVYSPSRWERRLVGSTLATIPHLDRTAGRTAEVAARGIGLIADLIGDDAPDVQKALSWALRTLHTVDPQAVAGFLRAEAATAATTDDGHRAWVIRDTLAKLPDELAAELRAATAGIRRHADAPSTSRAAATAAAFAGLGVDIPPAQRPIVPRA